MTVGAKIGYCSSTLAKGRTAEPLRRENKLDPQNTCSRETHDADAKRQVQPKLMGAEAGSPHSAGQTGVSPALSSPPREAGSPFPLFSFNQRARELPKPSPRKQELLIS